MKASASKKRSAPLSVVVSVSTQAGQDSSLLSLSKVCGKAQWIFVDAGDGSAAALASSKALKSMKAEALSVPQSGDWGRFCAAAETLHGKACLFLPQGSALSSKLFKGLRAALAQADLVFSRRPDIPAWTGSVQNLLWKIPSLDLGSAFLAKGQAWANLSQAKKSSAYFLGPQIAASALASSMAVKQCMAEEASGADAFSVLGEGERLSQFSPNLIAAAAGALLCLLAMPVMHWSNFFGLVFLGAGFFFACSAFGRD
jgi:hypothetical protein